MKLLQISLISVVFVGSFVLSVSSKNTKILSFTPQDNIQKSAMPVLASGKTFPIVSAQGVIAIDLDSAVVLYEKDADLKLLPASTTKIATAMVAMDHWRNQDEIIKIGKLQVDGQKMGLVEGEQLSVRNLLDGLLIYSANDAAEAFAASYPSGKEAFVSEMNKKTQDANLLNTHFANPTGLDEDGHVSTARDMIRLAEVAMKNPLFAEIVATKQKVVKSQDGRIVHYLTNINELLGKVEGVKGIKTGWTENARENLVTYVQRGDKKVIIALLGSQDRFGETKELIDWIYSSYDWQVAPYYKEVLSKLVNLK